MELTPQDRADARAIFEGQVDGVTACHFCAGIHARVAGLEPDRQPCPRVRRVERHPDGSVLAVEYWEPGERELRIVYPADAYDDEDEQSGG